MDLTDFKRFCFSYRWKTQGRIDILRDEILQDPDFCKELFNNTENSEKIIDLKLMEIIGYSFICSLHRHLKPEYDERYSRAVRLLERKLKCCVHLNKYGIKKRYHRSVK